MNTEEILNNPIFHCWTLFIAALARSPHGRGYNRQYSDYSAVDQTELFRIIVHHRSVVSSW